MSIFGVLPCNNIRPMPVVPEVLHVVFCMVWFQYVCHGCSSARAKRQHPTREADGWLGAGKMGTGSAFSTE